MITVKFFGLARLELKTGEVQLEAKSVGEALNKLIELFPEMTKKRFKAFNFYLNGDKLGNLFITAKKLKADDVLTLMSSVAGG